MNSYVQNMTCSEKCVYIQTLPLQHSAFIVQGKSKHRELELPVMLKDTNINS